MNYPLSAAEETAVCMNDEPTPMASLDEANITCPNSPTTDRIAAVSNNRPTGKVDLEDTTAAENNKKPPGMSEATTPSWFNHDSDVNKTSTNEEIIGFVGTKTWTKYLKRIC